MPTDRHQPGPVPGLAPSPRLALVVAAALVAATGCGTDRGADTDEGGAPTREAGAPPADTRAAAPGRDGDTAADAPGSERTRDPRTADPSFDPAGGEPAFDLPTLLDRVDERDGSGRLVVLQEARAPLAREDVAVQNRHDPARTDTVRTLRWAGLEVELYEVSASGRQMIQTITVDGDDYRTSEGLTAGSRRSEVEAAMGEPDRTEEGAAVYVLGGPEAPTPPELHVHYENGFVQRLVWHYYVD